MSDLAFVGDIHGSLAALDGLLDVLSAQDSKRLVFLGDYINKGPDSKAVLERLFKLRRTQSAVLLRGNHETALLRAVEQRDISGFLKMGGAATIRSYVGGPVSADALGDFLRALPEEHIEFIRSMPGKYRTASVVAQHEPIGPVQLRYRVSAHRPVGLLPKIDRLSAQIDTGCGDEGGRLTAFLWPSRRCVQVDSNGRQVSLAAGA